MDFQLKKHIVRKDDKDDIEIDITFEYKEKFICFVRDTLISSKYQLGKTLGSGVSCKVKLAKDENDNRIAIKLMKGDGFSDLVQVEIETLKKVNHRHVIRLIPQ